MLPVPSLPPGRVLDTNACSFVPGNPLSPSLRLFLSPPPCLGAANALAIILRLLRVLCQIKAPRAPPCNRSYSNKHRRSRISLGTALPKNPEIVHLIMKPFEQSDWKDTESIWSRTVAKIRIADPAD